MVHRMRDFDQTVVLDHQGESLVFLLGFVERISRGLNLKGPEWPSIAVDVIALSFFVHLSTCSRTSCNKEDLAVQPLNNVLSQI